MKLLSPFRGLRPVTERVADVVAPPYDVVNTAEARELASNKPWSFLHVSKPEIDLPEDTDPYDESVYQRGAENFDKMIKQGVLIRDQRPCFYLYELTMGEHVQTGIAAAASIDAYDKNIIRKHEFTRPVKEDDRVRQIKALRAQTGPVFLTYRQMNSVDKLVEQKKAEAPVYDLTSDDGVRHRFWVVDDSQLVAQMESAFSQMDYLYIADGHHRSAAASRVCAMNNTAAGGGDGPCKHFLAVLFPDNQVDIIDYNRVVKDLNGHAKEEFIDLLRDNFDVKCIGKEQFKPSKLHEFSMYLDGIWYALEAKPGTFDDNDPIGCLDVTVLSNSILDPVLGIEDLRKSKRIDFVGGIRGLEELERRVNSGEMKVAFALYPVSMKQLMDIADNDMIMPPKVTWFEPKLRSGLVTHLL